MLTNLLTVSEPVQEIFSQQSTVNSQQKGKWGKVKRGKGWENKISILLLGVAWRKKGKGLKLKGKGRIGEKGE